MNIPRSIWVILWLDSDRFHRSSGTRYPSKGMNNHTKVIERMAYGYRDSEYFFLKIKAALPGEARCTFLRRRTPIDSSLGHREQCFS